MMNPAATTNQVPAEFAVDIARLNQGRDHRRLVSDLGRVMRNTSEQDREDAISSATTLILEQLDADPSRYEYRSLGATRGLLLTIAHRQLSDELSRDSTTQDFHPSDFESRSFVDMHADPADEFDRSFAELQVQNLIAPLSRKQRIAVAAHDGGERTYKEVALVIGCTPEATRKLLKRAYESLHHQISDGQSDRCDLVYSSAIVAVAAGTANGHQISIADAHLSVCSHCKSTYAEMRRQSRDIAAATPLVPFGFLTVLGAKLKGAVAVLGGAFKSGGAAAPGHDGGTIAATAGGSAAAAGGGGAASSGLLTAGGILGSKAAVTACIAVTAATGTCAAVFGPEIVKSSEPAKSEQKAEAPADPTVIAPAPPEGTGTLPDPAAVEAPAEPKKTEKKSEPKKESAAPQAPESATSVPESGDSGWGFDEGGSSAADAAPADPAPEPSAPSNSSPANDAPSGGFGFQ